MTRSRPLVVALVLALLASGPAAGHKLKVFAAAEGARIRGSAYFAGGAGAGGARIEVRDAQGQVLAELAPDPQGGFSYTATAPLDHVILALTGDGHQASWTVKGAELAGGFPAAVPPALDSPQWPAVGPAADSPADSQAGPAPPAAPGAGLDPAALAAIETAVARQVRPLREELDAAQDRARLHDILGGIGYILGVAGLALWWGNRPGRSPRGPT